MKDVFEADLFAIVSKNVGKADAAGLRAEPESMLLVAAAAYAVSSVETCVKSGRKFHSRQDLVAVTHCALAALATSRDLLGLPAQEHLDKRNRIYGVVMPTARWLYGDRAPDDLIWKVCDVAIKARRREAQTCAKSTVLSAKTSKTTSQQEGEWEQLS